MTGISSTATIQIGMGVTGTNIPSATVVTAILSSSSISISNTATGSATVALTFDDFRVCYGVRIAGSLRFNGSSNVFFDDVTYGPQQDCVAYANSDDVTNDAIEFWGRAPFDHVIDRPGQSGYRLEIKSSGSNGTNPGSNLYRIINETTGRNVLKVNGSEQLVTAGFAPPFRAISDTSATFTPQDFEIGWATLSASRTGTLPALSTVANGTRLRLSDYSGAASPSVTITATPNGVDTIVGSAIIAAPYGQLSLVSNGSAWVCVPLLVMSDYANYLQVGARLDAQTATTTMLSAVGAGAASGASGANGVVYLDPVDWAAGRTAQLRLRVAVVTNATAPTCNFTVGLYPVTAAGGGAAAVNTTLGSVVSGSTAAITAPASTTTSVADSGSFPAPSAGYFAIAVVVSANMATNSSARVNVFLDRRAQI